MTSDEDPDPLAAVTVALRTPLRARLATKQLLAPPRHRPHSPSQPVSASRVLGISLGPTAVALAAGLARRAHEGLTVGADDHTSMVAVTPLATVLSTGASPAYRPGPSCITAAFTYPLSGSSSASSTETELNPARHVRHRGRRLSGITFLGMSGCWRLLIRRSPGQSGSSILQYDQLKVRLG